MPTQDQVNQALSDLAAQATKNTDAEAAAVQVINGGADRIQAALDAYKAANPTVSDDQLAGIQSEITALKGSSDALGAAVVANTPAATTPPADGGGTAAP